MKTADEMFRALGYKRINAPAIVYHRVSDEADVEKIVINDFGAGLICECLINGDKDAFLAEEILACAQLIKEMECQ